MTVAFLKRRLGRAALCGRPSVVRLASRQCAPLVHRLLAPGSRWSECVHRFCASLAASQEAPFTAW